MSGAEPIITAAERAYGAAFDRVCAKRGRIAALQATWEHSWISPEQPGNPEKYAELMAVHADIVAEADAAGKTAVAQLKGLTE